MPQSPRALIRCLAFLLALFISAGACLASAICVEYKQCHSCDYFDKNGNFLFNITWCWTN
jgi:hypothetical protein